MQHQNRRRKNYRQQSLSPKSGKDIGAPSFYQEEIENSPGNYAGNAYNENYRVGDLLRRQRELRGEDIYRIADFLRIKPNFLFALENSKYDELPADAYVMGFLRTYASYLGLDGKSIIDRYRREMAGQRRKPALNMPQPIPEGKAPTALVIIIAIFLAVIVYSIWYNLSSTNREIASKPPSLPKISSQPQSTNETTAVNTKPEQQERGQIAEIKVHPNEADSIKITASPPSSVIEMPKKQTEEQQIKGDINPIKTEQKPSSRVILRAEKNAWVLVVDGKGNTIFDQIMKPGEVFNVPDAPDLFLTTGNGGGLAINVDGIDLPRLSPDSRLIRSVPLDPEKLKNHFNPKKEELD